MVPVICASGQLHRDNVQFDQQLGFSAQNRIKLLFSQKRSIRDYDVVNILRKSPLDCSQEMIDLELRRKTDHSAWILKHDAIARHVINHLRKALRCFLLQAACLTPPPDSGIF